MIDRVTAPRPHSTPAERQQLADQVSERLGWLRMEFAAGPLPSLRQLWSTAELARSQRRGADPTAPWREGLSAAAARQYGASPPPAYAATFVLQWVLQVLAHPAAHVAELSPWALDSSAASVRFELDPLWWSPRVVIFEPRALLREPDVSERWRRAEAAYTAVAVPFARGYPAGVKMSSRQRLGSVRDMWRIAAAQARGTSLGAVRSGESLGNRREACCFIFVLPGATECAACPRLG